MATSFQEGFIQASLKQQIRNILHQYPDDGQILKELIQNAEDAGAKTVKFMYDKSRYGTKKLHHHGLADHQGPALYAYNDSVFSPDDWKGIRMLQHSIKSTDTLKVGRFGLGFKSVFHMTDLPGILSGTHVGFLDPREIYFEKAEEVIPESDPSKKWKKSTSTSSYDWTLSPQILRQYPDQFQPFIQTLFGTSKETFQRGEYHGTILRFPLRCSVSDISKTIYNNDEKVDALMTLFENEAHYLLLFLKHVEEIEFYVKDGIDAEPALKFSLKISENVKQSVRQERVRFVSRLKGISKANKKEVMKCNYYLETERRKTTTGRRTSMEKKSWIITQYYNGYEYSKVSSVFKGSHNIPLVGVALPLQKDRKSKSGHVFCFLPMPLDDDNETGLRVHVNGYFAVDQNRRHLKLPVQHQVIDGNTETSLRWNSFLIENILPMAMVGLIEYSTQYEQIKKQSQVIYQIFPDESAVRDQWKPLLRKFIEKVQEINCLYSVTNKWINPNDAYFINSVKSKFQSTVKHALAYKNIPVAEPEKHVVEMLADVVRPVTPEMIRTILLLHKKVLLSKQQRQDLVQFLFIDSEGSCDLLLTLPLITLSNGRVATFQRFSSLDKSNVYIDYRECTRNLLPQNSGDVMVDCGTGDECYDTFCEIAESGETQVQLLQPHHIPKLLHRLFGKTQLSYKPQSRPLSVGKEWLKNLWTFIIKYHCNQISQYDGLPIVPVSQNHWTVLSSSMPYIAENTKERSLSDIGIQSATLKKLGIKVVKQWGEVVGTLKGCLVKYISQPTTEGVLDALMKIRQGAGSVNEVEMTDLTDSERLAFRKAICRDYSKLQVQHENVVDSKLPLIQCYPTIENQGGSWESGSAVDYIADFQYDIPLPCKIGIQNKCEEFSHTIGKAIKTSSYVLKEEIFPNLRTGRGVVVYDENDIRRLMKQVVKDIYTHSEHGGFMEEFKKVPFMSTKSRTLVPPCELLYASSKEEKQLFGVLDIFPHGEFSDDITINKMYACGAFQEISGKHILQLAEYVEKNFSKKGIYTHAMKLFKYVDTHYDVLSEPLMEKLKVITWVPVQLEKPKYFPTHLPWFGQSKVLAKPVDLFSQSYECTVASIKPILFKPNSEIATQLLEFFEWERIPALDLIICQLKEISRIYEYVNEADNDWQNVSMTIQEIYKCLTEYDIVEVKKRLNNMKWVWNGAGFSTKDNVVLTRPPVNTKPYVYCIPAVCRNILGKKFLQIIRIKENIDLFAMLGSVKEFHDRIKNVNKDRIDGDRKMCLDILHYMKKKKLQLADYTPIPVRSIGGRLTMKEIKFCVYCDQKSYKKGIDISDVIDSQDDNDDEIYLVHEDIPTSLAQAINVSSLITRYFDAEALPVEYGQTEPLSRRINMLLEDYKDGSSILKELLQNADDAGATEVSFIYDARDFTNGSGLLFDEKMRELQGPSLLCHNNAVFTEDDFTNIVKLSGATKKEKTDKIGRFGLGFNTVYNLTDVPSFISGRSVVFFDPQVKYLGQAIKNPLQPGIKLDLEKHGKKLKRMKEQFQPFQGVMSCNLDKTCYEGTLFRFPLRTKEQARNSEISSKHYNLKEVRVLFDVFKENARHLLLFTQNIVKVNFFEVKNTEKDAKLSHKGSVKKNLVQILTSISNSSQSNISSEMKILEHVSKAVKRNVEMRNHLLIKTTVELKRGDIFTKDFSSFNFWSVSNVIGNESAKHMAVKQRDLVPVGGIAVELQRINKSYQLKPLKHGDELHGQIFCFFPLPIKSGLPFHVNGYFAVTSNRRQLCMEDFQDISDNKAYWNIALMEDPVKGALVGMLLDMISRRDIFDEPQLKEYIFNIFPSSIQEKIEGKINPVFKFVMSFYKTLIQNGNLQVLPSDCVWSSFYNIHYLDMQLREVNIQGLEAVGDTMILECKKFYQKPGGKRFVDIPEKIFSQMIACGFKDQILCKRITLESFYRDIFLPNIVNIECRNRNRLLLFALLYCRQQVDGILKESRCIQVTSGQFVKPCRLIDPKGCLVDLYDTQDNVFPTLLTDTSPLNFLKSETSVALQRLGMRRDSISNNEIIQRAETICIRLLSKRKGTERCKCLLELLSRQIKDNCFSQVCFRLKKIAFLPVYEKSKKWRLAWGASDYQSDFVSMNEAFIEAQMQLVGCGQVIATFPHSSNELKHAFGYVRKEVTLQQIEAQLNCIRDYITSTNLSVRGKTAEKKLIEGMLAKVYLDLNRKAQYAGMSQEINTRFSNADIIKVDCRIKGLRLISPKLCCMNDFDGQPYLYSLLEPIKSSSHLAKALDIQTTFTAESLVAALQRMESEGEFPLNDRNISVVHNISTLLVKTVKHENDILNDYGPVFLPDSMGFMCEASLLCYNNCPWLESQEHRFLHEAITFRQADILGVKTLREELYGRCQNGIPFGQREKLTNRIKRILDGYPSKEILKELLQNADDAEANEIHFILDPREHEKEKIFSKRWAALQGPALLVYNNKRFTEADLEGIRNLGEGSKSSDPLTTGKYGVGFNCVYHLTDTPTFLTSTVEGDLNLVAFDPQCKYVPGSDALNPGQMWKNIKQENLTEKFPHVFKCYSILNDLANATMFRFPLRNKEMSRVSDISKEEITVESVRKLLHSFVGFMEEYLFFLKNVRKITVSEIGRNGKLRNIHKVTAYLSMESMFQKTSFINKVKHSANIVKERNINDIEKCQGVYEMEIAKDKKPGEKWLVIEQVGFHDSDCIDRNIITEYKRNECSLLPRGGIACRLSQRKNNKPYKLYCFLPLPIETKFPMHINGYFVLNHESRRDLWHDEKGYEGFKTRWNWLIFRSVISDCYVTAMERMKSEINMSGQYGEITAQLNWYSSLYPGKTDGESGYMKYLEKSIYQEILQREAHVLPVVLRKTFWSVRNEHADMKEVDVQWYPASSEKTPVGFFDNLPNDVTPTKKTPAEYIRREEYIRNVLANSRFPIVRLPNTILENLKEASDYGILSKFIDPKDVLEFYLNAQIDLGTHIEHSPFCSFEAIKYLLRYCKDELHHFLDGLPLLVSADGIIHKFDKNSHLLLSRFLDLIPSRPDLFAHTLYLGFTNVEGIDDYLKEMCCTQLEQLLHFHMDETLYKGQDEVTFDAKDDALYICRIWEFINSQSWTKERKFNDSGIQILKDWCLLPVLTGKKETPVLWPLAKAHILIDSSGDSTSFEKILKKLCFPEPYMFPASGILLTNEGLIKIINQIVANIKRPCGILEAMFQAVKLDLCDFTSLKTDECKAILEYFSTNLDKLIDVGGNLQTKLKTMPFFETIKRSARSIDQCIYTYTIPNRIPEVDSLGEGSNNVYLYKHTALKELYMYLEITHLIEVDVYSHHILPVFHKLSTKERDKHLLFLIRLPQDTKYNNILLNALKTTKIFQSNEGTLEPARAFFDPTVTLFKEMEQNFPPEKPYCEDYWLKFLRHIGLQHEVTAELFLNYAKIIERTAAEKSTDRGQVIRQSETLCKALFESDNPVINNIAGRIRRINFIPQAKPTEQQVNLYKSYRNDPDCFIHFEGSLIFKFSGIVWTQCDVLPEWAVPKDDDICTNLGVLIKPQIKTVIENIKSISSVQNTGVNFLGIVSNFIKAGFDYLNEYREEEDVQLLSQLACIPIEGSNTLIKPSQVSKNIPKEIVDKVEPYLCSFPYVLGPYVELLQLVGVTDNATVQQYANVLEIIYTDSKGDELGPNEMCAASYASKGLFGLYSDAAELQGSLHVLTIGMKLDLSVNVILLDHIPHHQRISGLAIPCLLHLKMVETGKVNKFFEKASDVIKPMYLSKVVKEQLDELAESQKTKTERCQRWEKHLSSVLFYRGVKRLIEHERRRDVESEDLDVLKALRQIQFFEIPSVETYLTYKGDKIERSEKTLPFFIKSTEDSTAVFLSSAEKNEDRLVMQLCDVVNSVIKGKLNNMGHYLNKILTCSVESIETLLNNFSIKAYDSISDGSDETNMNLPIPGEYIPLKFHFLLQPCIEMLRPGEYVGYEQYDKFDDSNTSDEDELDQNPVFRYAKVMEVVKTGDETSYLEFRYKIDLGGPEYKTVHASMLYRFTRKAKSTSTSLVLSDNQSDRKDLGNLSEIKAKITKILEKAWKMDEDVKRRIIKRLFLEWHPDKNPENIKLCTEIFQFIQNELERLEKGLPTSEGASNFRRYSSFNFRRYYGRRARSHREYRQQYEAEHESEDEKENAFFTPPRRDEKNPQPDEARRWMKQAEYDLEAVSNDLTDTRGFYEWACFKCHQAAEKALKATQFAVDSRLKDNRHALYNLCNAIDDNNCKSVSRMLELLLGGSTAMRYPDRHCRGCTPHDAFTRQKAKTAKEHASNILEMCRAFLRREFAKRN